MINCEQIIESCQYNSIAVNTVQAEKLAAYSNMILKQNEYINLTRNDSEEEMINKNIIDSMRVVPYIGKDSYTADIGCGAGFPGIVISIMTGCKMVLVDSIAKKIDFINAVKDKLELDIVTLNNRAEIIGRDEEYREKFDFVVSRALAPLNVLLEYSIPLLKNNGCLIAMKGSKAAEEVQDAEKALRELNSECIEYVHYCNFDDIDRSLLFIYKRKNTPDIYPRSTKKIVKRPL